MSSSKETKIVIPKVDTIDSNAEEEKYDVNIIEPTKNLNQLEDEYNKYMRMTKYQRKLSDRLSITKYGMNNVAHYNALKQDITKEATDLSSNRVKFHDAGFILKNVQYDFSDVEDAKEWAEKSNITIIYPTKSLEELEDLHRQFYSMYDDLRRKSNTKSLEIFRMKNEEHYRLLKSAFLATEDNGDDQKDLTTPDLIKIAALTIKEESTKPKTIKETLIKKYTIRDNKELFLNKVSDIVDNIPDDIPYYTPDELLDMDIIDNSILDKKSDNLEGDPIAEYNKAWGLVLMGVIPNNLREITNRRNERLSTLEEMISKCDDEDKLKELKLECLRLGWNYNIPFNNFSRAKVNESAREKLISKLQVNCIDMTRMTCNENTIIKEDKNIKDKLYPVYIVLVYNNLALAKLIRGVTQGKYTHAAIGLDADLKRLYSYNMANGTLNGGFSLESIDRYISDTDRTMISVHTVFVKHKELLNIRTTLDKFIANRDKTNYSLLNLLTYLTGKNVQFDTSMICSQFVDFVLKSSKIDITHKVSSLVAPNDFYTLDNKRVYKIYEGLAIDYNYIKVNRLIKSMSTKAVYINESLSAIDESSYIDCMLENIYDINTLLYIDSKSDILSENTKRLYDLMIKPYIEATEYIYEVKSFPVQFDKDGNLFIDNLKKMDYEQEYSKAHILLKTYDESDNIEGMKYELSKLWLMNNILEQKLYNSPLTKSEKEPLLRVRSRILNDFKKYIKVVNKKDKEFIFTKYYEESPFSDSTIKINNSTLKYSGKLLSDISKFIML